MASAGLCGGHFVRGDDQRAAHGIRRPLLHRCRSRGAGDVHCGVAGLCAHLSMALTPVIRSGRRGRTDAAGLAGVPLAATASWEGNRSFTYGVSDFIMAIAIKRVPIGEKFDIRALKPQTTSAISIDWKLYEYDLEKPAQGRKSRHRFLGRSRHQRGAAVDETKGRPRLCLYRESRPARRG